LNKNIIILTCQDLSDYKKPIAPAFWRTIDAYCQDHWKVFIINAHRHRIELYKYKDRYWYCEFQIPLQKMSRLRKIGKIFAIAREKGITCQYKRIAEGILQQAKSRGEQSIVYSYEVSAVAAGTYLSKKYQTPLVTRFQGTILYNVADTWINRFRYYPHFNALETESDLVVMTNDGTQGDKLLERLKNHSRKILFYRNGVERNTNAETAHIEGVEDHDKVLMTLSRLASWKRVDRAISCLPDVIKRYPNTKLVIVGYGEEENTLRELAKSLAVEKNVIFAGQVKHKDTSKYLKRADVFLSLYDLSNVGNPLLEAMCCGKPIITLDVGDTKSVIKNDYNGILLSTNEINRIPEKIIQLFDDAEYVGRLGRNAEKYARENFWTWDERLSAELKEVNKLIEG
jgi:glycosyltransferase involved in cell wall biosynthesis